MAKSTAAALKKAIRSVEALVEHPSVSDRELLRRFAEEDDQPAFAALVRRYTGMVLGVCRRALPTVQDAEDACQATFLVLARKATAGRWRQSVANWLYTTARRVSSNARLAAERRAKREGRAAVAAVVSPVDHVTGRELLAALDEELEKLAARYREPLVLCYLEGLTRDEVAARLGIPAGTVKTQLERGREKLGLALTRRGCGLGAGLLALAVTSPAGASPPRLVQAVLAAVSGTPPAAVAALAKEVSVNGLVLKSISAVVAVAAAVFGVGVAGLKLPAASGSAASRVPAKMAALEGKEGANPLAASEEVTVSGRVLSPEGKPVAGARLYLPGGEAQDKLAAKVRATTDKEGRFHFSGSKGASPLVALAEGYGLAWVSDLRKSTGLTLELVKDDVPVAGRILDLQGKPVPGATVKVNAVKSPAKGSLDAWLGAVKVRKEGIPIEHEHLPAILHHGVGHLFPNVTTDKEGRFRLAGVGRERVVALIVQGPTLQTMEINAITRPGVASFTKPYYELGWRDQLIYYGASFDHATPPGRPITGVVRDRATGLPVAAAAVRAESGVGNPRHYPQATADKEGRYRLNGLGKGEEQGQTILALSPEDQPYLGTKKKASGGTGLGPISLDFELTKGVWLEGSVTDKATRRGVEAVVGYFVFESALEEGESNILYLPFFGDTRTDRQGKFRLVAHPGRGLVGVRAVGAAGERYCVGVGAEAIKGSIASDFPGLISFPTYPRHALPRNFDGLKEVKPAAGDKAVTCDVVLDPGRPLTVRVEGPAGEPLAGARVRGQLVRELWGGEPVQAEFPVFGLKPGESRTLLFRHEGKGLAGLLKIKGDERGPLTVRLVPAAAVSGRLLDDDGRPLGHAEISVRFFLKERPNWVFDHHPGKVYTDPAGKFRIEGLVPAMKYHASTRVPGRRNHSPVFTDLPLEAGQTKDLGDVRTKREEE